MGTGNELVGDYEEETGVRTVIIFLAGILYVVTTVITAGALFADVQSIGDKKFADRDYRSDLSLAILFGMIPIFWLLFPFLTGFCEHGWTLSRRKD